MLRHTYNNFLLQMNFQKHKVLAVILMASFLPTSLQSTDCVVEDFPKTRTFSSLDEYQSTRNSFNPHHSGYLGNVVDFSFEKLEVIPKNAFISFNSEAIVQLNLQNKQIKKIDSGAFLSLECLNELNLSHNNLTDIVEGTFEGLGNLKNLLLDNNLLESTPDGGMAFLHLESLEILNLSMNRIKTVQRISFDALIKLEVLDLGYNRIRFIDDTVFNPLVSLEILLLNNNYLTTISPQRWENLDKLTYLNLAENFLTSFDAGYNFSFPKLTKLNLSGNALTVLNGYEIKHFFKNLEQLDIGNNFWTCRNLNAIRSSIYGSKIRITEGIKCTNQDHFNWSIPKPPPEDSQEPSKNSNVNFKDCTRKNISKEIKKDIISEQKKVMVHLYVIQNLFTFLSVAIVISFLLFVIVKLEACNVMSSYFGYRENHYSSTDAPEMYRLIRR